MGGGAQFWVCPAAPALVFWKDWLSPPPPPSSVLLVLLDLRRFSLASWHEVSILSVNGGGTVQGRRERKRKGVLFPVLVCHLIRFCF